MINWNNEISDEMLAAYLDGNATIEECNMISEAIQHDNNLSESIDIANDHLSFGHKTRKATGRL